MRCWKLPDGRLLAEQKEGIYWVLLSDGRLERCYQSGSCAEGGHLMSTTYFIDGGELRSRFTDDHADSPDLPTVKLEIELRGLAATDHPGIEELLGTALAVQEVRGRAAAQKEADRLAGFERGLPEFQGQDGLDFVFAYDKKGDIVVRGPADVEVWREADYPNQGRFRFAQLEDILRRRYGRRLRSFTPHLPDIKSAMAFNPE